jgi:hypothetical protein
MMRATACTSTTSRPVGPPRMLSSARRWRLRYIGASIATKERGTNSVKPPVSSCKKRTKMSGVSKPFKYFSPCKYGMKERKEKPGGSAGGEDEPLFVPGSQCDHTSSWMTSAALPSAHSGLLPSIGPSEVPYGIKNREVEFGSDLGTLPSQARWQATSGQGLISVGRCHRGFPRMCQGGSSARRPLPPPRTWGH